MYLWPLQYLHNYVFLLSKDKEHVQALSLQLISKTDFSVLNISVLKGQQTLKRKRHI